MADDSYRVELIITANGQGATATLGSVTQNLGRMDDAQKRAAQSGGALENSYRRLQQVMDIGIAGALLQRVTNTASEMYELGSANRVAIRTFEELTDGGEATARMLDLLRDRTGGIINDFQLMQGASKYLSMGLGETQDEIATLIDMAVKLGGAMGNEAGQSIEDFALMLANESVLRLDTFGISSERVQRRMEELQATGEALNRSDAFRMAVMEEGANSLDRLGDAVTAVQTPIARLQTQLENFWANVSDRFAQGVNGLIGGIQLLDQATQDIGARDLAAQQERFARQTVIAQGFAQYQTALDPDIIQMVIEEAVRALQQNPDLELLNPDSFTSFLPFGDMTDFTEEQWQQYAGLLGFIQEQNALMNEAVRIQTQQQQAIERRSSAESAYLEQLRQEQIEAERASDAAGRRLQIAGIIDPAVAASQQLFGLVNPIGRGSIGGATLFTADELAQAEQLARTYEQALDYATTMHEQGLISDEQLDYLERGADEVERMRDAAREGAEAFREMTLAQAFGEGARSPLISDLSGEFLDFMRGMDMPESDFAKLQDTILLASGQVTEASIVFRDQVLPLVQAIFESQGAGAAAEALANLEQFLQEAATAGYTPEQIATMLPTQTGYVQYGGSAPGMSFTVNPGDTPLGVAARYGLTLDQVYAGAGTTNPYGLLPGTYATGGGMGYVPADAFGNPAVYGFQPLIPGIGMTGGADAATATDPFKAMSDSTQKIAADLDLVAATLEDIGTKEYKVKMDIEPTAPAWLIRLLHMAGGAEFLEAIISDNGGSAPGYNPRGTARPYSG